MTTKLELTEIQGLLMYGYRKHPAASYLFATVHDSAACRAWLEQITPQVTHADADKARTHSVNIALTYPGLETIAGPDQFAGFSREFVEGMVTPHRQRILGDLAGSVNDPLDWDWGGPNTPKVHVLVMLFARTRSELNALELDTRTAMEKGGMTIVHCIQGNPLAEGREHFGFKDGITNPRMHADQSQPDGPNDVRAGQFVLGYANQIREQPMLPTLGDEEPSADAWGRNASYLVFRQLEQDVRSFWTSIRSKSRSLDVPSDNAAAVRLAAKMVGRWPNGVPLTLAPEHAEDCENPENLDNFGFVSHGDGHGLKCPVGAHIRRANPRDGLTVDNADTNPLLLASRRILRRGRTYGSPLVDDVVPADARTRSALPDAGVHTATQTDGDDGRGLLFLCLNANLATQYEFVQQTWLNSAKFNHATDSIDPIAGAPTKPGAASSFVVQDRPVHRRVHDWTPPIRVRGGAYFFLPSISALGTLAESVPE